MHSIFFLLTGASYYYHAIHIVLTYFASFTGYDDDIFKVLSSLKAQGSKLGRKFDKFGEFILIRILNSAELMEFVFA